jgi:hypothetical protein
MAEMKNYAAMAQGMPQQEVQGISAEEQQMAAETALTPEEMEAINLPTGSEAETVKERILTMMERFGLMEGLSGTQKIELMQQVDALVEDIVTGNIAEIEKNPVNQMLIGATEQLQGQYNPELEAQLEQELAMEGEEDAA